MQCAGISFDAPSALFTANTSRISHASVRKHERCTWFARYMPARLLPYLPCLKSRFVTGILLNAQHLLRLCINLTLHDATQPHERRNRAALSAWIVALPYSSDRQPHKAIGPDRRAVLPAPGCHDAPSPPQPHGAECHVRRTAARRRSCGYECTL